MTHACTHQEPGLPNASSQPSSSHTSHNNARALRMGCDVTVCHHYKIPTAKTLKQTRSVSTEISIFPWRPRDKIRLQCSQEICSHFKQSFLHIPAGGMTDLCPDFWLVSSEHMDSRPLPLMEGPVLRPHPLHSSTCRGKLKSWTDLQNQLNCHHLSESWWCTHARD